MSGSAASIVRRAMKRLLLGSLGDLEATTLRRRRRGHRDFEHAIVEVRLRLFGDRAFGQRHDATEAAVAPLASIVPLAFLFLLALAFTLNRDGIIGDVHR